MNFLQVFLALFSTVVLVSGASDASVEKDLTITAPEKAKLDKFRSRVLPSLYKDYMKTDIFLIRYLRAKNFDVQAAEKMLMNTLRWRKENSVDTIDNEDWSYFERMFAYSVEPVDKKGQPLLIISPIIPWDIRAVIVQGRKDKLIRWMIKMLENASQKVRELQDSGHNVTRFSMVNTLENFNLIESGCLQCLSLYIAFTNNYENHYPELLDEMILVNTPGVFDSVMSAIRPFLSPQTRRALRLLGTNKKQWIAELRKIIDDDELPVDFGGSKEIFN